MSLALEWAQWAPTATAWFQASSFTSSGDGLPVPVSEHGRQIWERASAVTLGLAQEILNGRDVREIPRFSDYVLNSPEEVRLDAASLEHERRVHQRQEWLVQRGLQ